jgi:internalin A
MAKSPDEGYQEAEARINVALLDKPLRLGLNNLRLTELPDSLGHLTHLWELYLGGNQLTTLPEGLDQLPQLRALYVYRNRLTTLPQELGQLTQLLTLDLSNNRLTTLPEELGQLTQLLTLDLSNNRLATLPEELGQLTQLLTLDLSNNRLTTLPESFQRLGGLKRLFLHGNTGLGLSDEILGPTFSQRAEGNRTDPRAILAAYFAQRQKDAKPLNEVKLLLVGHGRVGKTSLSKALRGVPHDEQEPETPGIERHPLELVAGRSTITAHIWDFGGQEFLHQTHQFFFSKRSIYVVVLTGRQGRPMQEAEYWLRLIRTYGTGSPVVIALNQIKAHPFSVDEYFLQENYPEVKAVVTADCDPRVGIEQLTKLLGKMAGRMPSVREKIDPAWTRVRNRLEEMQASFVSFAEYRNICAAEGIGLAEKQETLATILDCLGIALNYRDDPRLRDTSVLKPRWLVDGIYEILRWLHKHETNGTLRIEDFPKALKSKRAYPPAMHGFLLALMEKFELCFQVESEDGTYLVPGLLNANQPRELKEFLGTESRRIQFRYDDVRPPGLLPRFIVRSHTLSEKQPRWLRGVVLARGNARALVRGDHEGRVTDVFALGDEIEDRVWLTEFILSEMRVLNDKLPVRTFVGSEDQPGAWTELELLRDADRNNEATRTERSADGSTVLVDVKQTLREVETAEASAPGVDPLPLFICYAHLDERAVKQLIPGLKVLARRGYVEPWRDTDLVPGENWDDTIKERLSRAQIILFMVSQAFLASDYITHKERPLAMELVDEKKAVVVPVILSACSHDAEDFARFENLPRKGKPVSSYSPRSAAWALVEAGIKKAVEKMRTLSERTPGGHRRP